MKNLIIIFFALTAAFNSLLSSDFYKLSEIEKNEVKQDSSFVWIANPIPDQSIFFNDTLQLDLNQVFSQFPDNIDWNPVIENPTLVNANIFQDIDNNLILKILSKSVYGRTDITYTAYFYTNFVYTDSTYTDSLATDTLSLSDIFQVRVDNPDYLWKEWGTTYSFSPDNSFGNGDKEWSAAQDFDLGNTVYELKEIEFGYSWDGVADWKIVKFAEVPTDSVIGSLYGERTFTGNQSEYITDNIPTTMTGHIAVIFTTTANFMPMDANGDSDHTWIYPKSATDSTWQHPEDISDDYAGAWYIRLLVNNVPTGIEEVFTTEKSPVLLQNYPNPFNNQTVISWNLHNSGQVELNIFNSKGQFVKNLVNESRNKGRHSAVFDADGLETGIYFYQIKINGKIENTEKMLYLK